MTESSRDKQSKTRVRTYRSGGGGGGGGGGLPTVVDLGSELRLEGWKKKDARTKMGCGKNKLWSRGGVDVLFRVCRVLICMCSTCNARVSWHGWMA